MSTESLKRVLTKIKAEAQQMRKQKYAARLAPTKPKDAPAAKGTEATAQIRELLSKG